MRIQLHALRKYKFVNWIGQELFFYSFKIQYTYRKCIFSFPVRLLRHRGRYNIDKLICTHTHTHTHIRNKKKNWQTHWNFNSLNFTLAAKVQPVTCQVIDLFASINNLTSIFIYFYYIYNAYIVRTSFFFLFLFLTVYT